MVIFVDLMIRSIGIISASKLTKYILLEKIVKTIVVESFSSQIQKANLL